MIMASARTERLARENYWEELLRIRDEQRKHVKSAVTLIKGKDLPLERNRQGLMRWYLHPSITDTAIRSLIIFVQEIPPGSRSGRVKFQGGQAIHILEGRGHTILDGVRYDWTAGDTLNLPLKKPGIVVQHVNDDPQQPARFVACEVNWVDCVGVDRGSGFEQIEVSPDYKR